MGNKVYLYVFFLFFLISWGSLRAQVTADFNTNNTFGCAPLLVHFKDYSSGGAVSWSWDFGNGGTSLLQNPSLIYTQPGVYTIKLTVKDAAGNTSVKVKAAFVQVFGNPTADFSVNKTSACPFSSFQFTDLSQPSVSSPSSIVQWQWDFGDGQGATTKNPSHVYSAAGTYTVKLSIKDANGCQHFREFQNLITIYDIPKALITASKKSSCLAPLSVNFTSASQSGVTYQWDFGDGGSSSQSSATHIFTTPGTYTVKLVARNNNGCTDSSTINIVVGNKQTDFSYVPSPACINNPVSFSSVNSVSPISQLWFFGDGDTAQSGNATHTYKTPGTYQVELVVQFADGCTDTIRKSVVIDDIPVVQINYTPSSSCPVPFNVTFTNPISNSSSEWDFGDGGTSTQKNVIHTYNSRGPFIVKNTVTTAGGCKATRIDTIDFNPKLKIIPSQKQFCGAASASVSFNYAPQYTQPNTPLSFNWQFGDGGTSTLAAPSHTYTTEGKFVVKLSITYPGGCVIEGYDTIQVFTYPIPNFTANIRDTCVKKTIQFTNLSSNFDSLIWDFGDKIKKYQKVVVPADAHATHQYRNPLTILELTDTFDVKLTLFNGPCMKDTLIKNYIRIRSPLAYTEPQTLYCDTPAVASLIDISRYKNPRDSVSRLWFFGDPFATLIGGLGCTIDTKLGQNVGQNCNRSVDSVTKHIYSKFGDYKAYLRTASKTTRCVDSFEFTIKVRPRYNLNFIVSTDSGCAPLKVNFNDTTRRTVKWFWDFGDLGDSDTDTVKAPVYTFRRPGNYTVLLRGKDSSGCEQIITKLIHVRGPLANFKISGKLCPPDTVKFTDLTVKTSGIKSWRWNFGDPASGTADTSSLKNASHRFSSLGSFVVMLTVTDSELCAHSTARIVNYGPPKPDFSAEPATVCQKLPVTFINNTPGPGLITYKWNFGDGDSSNTVSPVHSYNDTGSYTVKLLAIRSDGCMDSISRNKLISVVKPQVDFKADNTNAFCPPFTVNFNDLVSSDIIAWKWDFGDSSYSTTANPVHTYSKPGTYSVTLWVESAGGCSDSIVYPDLIKVGGPTGTFSFSPDSGCIPLGVTFKASSKGAILYTWDYADGKVDNGNSDSIFHLYVDPGTFKPVLILTDTNNCSISYQSRDSVFLLPAIQADFVVSNKQPCIGNTVTFTDQSTTPVGVSIVNWWWQLGDSSNASGNPAGHAYAKPGIYDVWLEVEDNRGCRDTVFKPALIKVSDKLQISVSPDTVMCYGDSVQLTASGGQQYLWWPATGLSDETIPNPIAKPLLSTQYSLVVKGAVGCDSSVAHIKLTVYPLPALNAGTDKVLCQGDSMQLQATGAFKYTWSPALGLSDSSVASPMLKINSSATYYIRASDTNGCVQHDTLNVKVVPRPVALINGNDSVCSGAVIKLKASGADTYQWSTGDKSSSIIQKVEKDTSYWVVPFVEGCSGTPDTLHVKVSGDVIKAGFVTEADTLFTHKTVYFLNTSKGADKYYWDFDRLMYSVYDQSTLKNPFHIYKNKGVYEVQLVVASKIGCHDTLIRTLVLIDNDIFFPTAFSPNEDGVNDYFNFVASSPIEVFEFSIYNRWGERIFRTRDKNSPGWDGSYQGKQVQQDVYAYTFWGMLNGKNINLSGTVTLIR